MAELFGRETGCCKGRGGSMHLTDVNVGLLGENGIVAAGLPTACGAAFSAKMRGTDQVALTFFGEGATNQGVFHEALNLAAAWELPVIFFCENNIYAEMTPINEEVKVESMTARATGNGIPSVQVDGNDLLAVYEATSAAVARARQGGGPTFIEAHTYRLVGHMIGDPEVYRTPEEVEAHKSDDPILRFGQLLRSRYKFGPQDLEGLQAEAKDIVDDCRGLRAQQPLPGPCHGDGVRLCLNDLRTGPHLALQEEMQRDPGVVLLGEDIGLHGGVIHRDQGAESRVWRRAGARHPHFGGGLCGAGGRSRHDRAAPGGRNHVHGFFPGGG